MVSGGVALRNPVPDREPLGKLPRCYKLGGSSPPMDTLQGSVPGWPLDGEREDQQPGSHTLHCRLLLGCGLRLGESRVTPDTGTETRWPKIPQRRDRPGGSEAVSV